MSLAFCILIQLFVWLLGGCVGCVVCMGAYVVYTCVGHMGSVVECVCVLLGLGCVLGVCS